ncbi:MAG: hypothetical protein HY814_01555, partial [Candidatus Riflebacteria bacterium]|nr:hypothetical protein [Candidatus Riflebacteria bacterium]
AVLADGNTRLQRLLDRARQKPGAPGAAAEPEGVPGKVREEYSVNAQYRGTVKKAFMDIGQAWVSFDTKSASDFGIRASGSVTDPENRARKYELDLDADFRRNGNTIDRLADRSKFNSEAEKHRDRVLKDLPFIYIAKYTPFPPVTSRDTTWTLNGQDFVVRHVRADGGEVQVTLLERGGMIGKIFLEPDEAIPHTIKKFRVMGTNDVVLSFVSSRYPNRRE